MSYYGLLNIMYRDFTVCFLHVWTTIEYFSPLCIQCVCNSLSEFNTINMKCEGKEWNGALT